MRFSFLPLFSFPAKTQHGCRPGNSANLARITLIALLWLGGPVCESHSQAPNPPQANPSSPEASIGETQRFFDAGTVPVIKLIIAKEKQDLLRQKPREFVSCSVLENEKSVGDPVGVKLKGAAGSFRDFDDRPGLTISMDKYKKGLRFHGMKKFHLNNAVQDPTFLNEWLGGEWFRSVGYPCPRVGHARVFINNRDLGLYVFREGFDEPFLKGNLPPGKGHLYDGGFLQDIDSELELDYGPNPGQRSNLVQLASACYQENPRDRWAGIEQKLDMDRFLTFMAMERLCGHWDGYTLNTNNYRLFFPEKAKALFLPHGMDQLFGDPNFGLYDHSHPLLAAAIMQNDAWRARYQNRLRELLPKFRAFERWRPSIETMETRLRLALEKMDSQKAKAFQEQMREWKDRVEKRCRALPELVEKGLGEPEIKETNKPMKLEGWNPNADGKDTQLKEVEIDGVAALHIDRGTFGDQASSWRRRILLSRGTYRFEARVQTRDVIPIPDDQARGAGVRLQGDGRSQGLVGTHPWKTVRLDIPILEDQKSVELILELRARHGWVWFDRASLKLTKIQ